MQIHRHPDLMQRLAAAHALGTLRGGARRRFEAIAREQPVVRAAALEWQSRVASLNELQRPAEPAPQVWTRIHNLVRGLQPWPLVSARIDGERVLIHRTKTTDQTGPQSPGTIVRADGERLEVVAGDGGVLRLMLIQPEGRRVMSAREFLAGRRVEPGARLERA